MTKKTNKLHAPAKGHGKKPASAKSKAAVSKQAKPSASAPDILKSEPSRRKDFFVVRGTVKTADGNPINGALVRAFDRDLRKDQLVGKARTTNRGEYVIRFGPAKFALGDIPSPSAPKLIVRAFFRDQQIGDDVSRPNSSREEVVDFRIPAPPVSEWEKLSTGVIPLLEGQGKNDRFLPPWEVNDDDLGFIAEETRLEREQIRLWALAFAAGRNLATVTPPTPEPSRAARSGHHLFASSEQSLFAIFYGWFRLGLPNESATLWTTPTEKLLATLNTAIVQNIVPASLGADQAGLRKWIGQNQADRALEAPVPGTTTRLSDLLATLPTSLNVDQQRAIATAIAELRPEDPGLVKRISDLPDFDGEAIPVARALRLGALTAGHLPLAHALQRRSEIANEHEGTLRPLAALRRDDWLDLAYTHGTPEGTTFTPAAYADALATMIERQHPHDALVANLVPGRRLVQRPALTNVAAFLQANPSFDIGTANLSILADQAELGDITEPGEIGQLVDGLRSLQRLHLIGASWDETATLLEHNIQSPNQLLAAGPSQLTTLLDGVLAPGRTTALYHEAEDLHATTFAAFTAIMSPLSGPLVLPGLDPDEGNREINPDDFGGVSPSLPPKPIPDDDSAGSVDVKKWKDVLANHAGRRDPKHFLTPHGELIPIEIAPAFPVDPQPTFGPSGAPDRNPTLRALFGDQDSCTCRHCNSVLGPAAYFVDVLQFIKNAGLDHVLIGNSARGFPGRRPDLQDIELSCENTNTEVPAIDLVLETLENTVAFNPPIDVLLPTSADVETLFVPEVGVEVRNALQKTVRTLSTKLTATRIASHGGGITDWTVVDDYRRWSLTSQNRGLRSVTDTGTKHQLDLAGMDLSTWIAALDQGQVPGGGEGAFASLLLPDFLSPPDLTNYGKTIIPQGGPGGKSQSWRIEYRIAAQLRFSNQSSLILQTPDGVVWWEKTYNPSTLQAVAIELANGVLPTLLKEPFAARFGPTPDLLFALTATNVWSIGSTKREFTLTFSPASLSLNSLTYQSGDPRADAIAWPENHNPAAYEKLKGAAAVFPWSLPVDLPLDEVRLFLERARSSRRSLLALTTPIGQSFQQTSGFAQEILGLSAAEAQLITLSQTDIFPNWGMTASQTTIWDAAAGGIVTAVNPLALLKNVSVLLQQSRLGFEEMQAVLATRFVSASATNLVSIQPPGSCKPSQMTLVNLTPAHLDRIHRFVRLQRRLGWSASDLDQAIPAGDPLNTTTLPRLAHLIQVREILALPMAVLLTGYESTVAAGEKLKWLARALTLTGGELDHACALFETADPFATPGDTLEFCERVQNWQSSGITFENLRYLLRHEVTSGGNADLDEKQLSMLAGTAREAVRSVPDAPIKNIPVPPTGAESADALAARQKETALITAENKAITLAADVVRGDAAVAAIATALGAAPDLVDELLRKNLGYQLLTGAKHAAIEAFLESSFLTAAVTHSPTAAISPATTVTPVVKAAVDAADQAVDGVLVRLHKALFICDALKLDQPELDLLRKGPADKNGFTTLDFNRLPAAPPVPPTDPLLTEFEQLLALVRLRRLAPGAATFLKNYAALIFPVTPAAPWDDTTPLQAMTTGLTLKNGQAKAAATLLQLTTTEQFRDPLVVSRLIELLVVLQQIGATTAQASDLTAPSPTDATATGARELLRAKYGDEQWHDLIKPIADRLRERQRDALVDYLIGENSRPRPGDSNPQIKPGLRLRDADDIYEHYLIDVQIGSCMKTTRLLLATAAAQLFVQRVMLNLERPLSLTDDKRALWDWMHNYRVWEANRKVFLYPENWLQPDLRDDKTAIFREMESALTEREPSDESTRSALLTYVEELEDLAQVTVIAMYQDQRLTRNLAGQTVIRHSLYAVGRTPDAPHRYLWRSCAEFGAPGMAWSGWETLDLDSANDFIMPFVFEDSLHVAWPTFRKTKEEKNDESAKLFWEVQLVWTRRTSKGWIKRKVGKALLVNIVRLPNKDDSGSFAFRLSRETIPVPGGDLLEGALSFREKITIDCYAAKEPVPIPSLTPNPVLLLNTVPTSVEYDRNKGGNTQWNVSLTVEGIVYRYYDLGQDQGGQFNAAYGGVTVELCDATRQNRENALSNVDDLLIYQTETDPQSGVFRFSFPTAASSPKNSNEGLLNGGSLKLRFKIGGKSLFETPIVKLVRESAGSPPEYSYNWTWKINHGVEDKTLAKTFDQARDVKLIKIGAFVLETGRDLTAKALTDATPYRNDMEGFIADNNWLPPSAQRGTPLVAVRATQSLGQVEPDIWWLKENDNNFCYSQLSGLKWQRWPDRQPFASIYRIDAASPGSTLFQIENQRHLHFDPAANNFDRQTVYSNYNWELFLHTPLAIANFLATQQRFEDARRWLHAIFNPTKNVSVENVREFWQFLPFRNTAQPDTIANLLIWLANPEPKPGDSAAETARKTAIGADLKYQIEQWKQNPFMPHLIARLRTSAYQWHTFFAYLDVLIGWGDQLFRRDTRESVNDATLLYVLAAKLLGPRPRAIAPPVPPSAETYRSLQQNTKTGLDDFSNGWVTYSDLPGVKQMNGMVRRASVSQTSSFAGTNAVINTGTKAESRSPKTPLQIITTLTSIAFCIPQNEKIAEFYDRLENRLFNVRNCRNIDGVNRELPLYEPAIDPLLLIRARAAGLSIDSVLANLYAPLPHYRFTFTLQKAVELCGELKALGSALLTALEKKDAEELTLLRSRHEIALLKLVRDTRKLQIAEAEANIAALQQSERTVLERFGQYQKLLGKPGVTKGQDGLPVVEQASSLTVSTDPVGGASGLGLINREVEQLVLTAIAHHFTQAANIGHVVAGVLSLVPNFTAGTPFASSSFGGTFLGSAASATAKAIEMGATEANFLASQAATFGGFQRRQDEWIHQSKLALAELKQIQKQIVAAEIRKDIAERELSNQDTQIENSREIEDFMRSKFTSEQLYRWMSSQIAEVYFRTYQLALDQARRAERTYKFELGLDDKTTPFVSAGNWDSLKRGLLVGEHLHHDLKRMESAYLERNVREFEITKHISLLQLAPGALIALRATGSCEFKVPEVFFDLDYPGHYMRRIRMVSLSIPCVTGPYAGVSTTLRLRKSEIRTKATANSATPYKQIDEDSRFIESNATIMAIVTSSAQQDSGMFEPNLRDERYLPFEGAGAISSWRLELPEKFHAFDYETIADVVLHLRYTARDGGTDFKEQCSTELEANLRVMKQTANEVGLSQVVSMRHEFPTEWHRFLNPGETKVAQTLAFELSPDRFPFQFRGRSIQINRMDLLLKLKDAALVDYQTSTPLAVEILPPGPKPVSTATPPTPTPQFVSIPGFLNGVPHAQKDFLNDFGGARTPGSWTLEIQEADIAKIATSLWQKSQINQTDHWRLRPALVDDIFVICHYSI